MDTKALVVALVAGASSATAGPLDGVPQARTTCAAISSGSPARALEGSVGQARAEADRLVTEAVALMAQPSRQSVTASLDLLERAVTLDPDNAVAFARLSAAHGQSKRYADVPHAVAAANRWAMTLAGTACARTLASWR
jgi:hypothetical protein